MMRANLDYREPHVAKRKSPKIGKPRPSPTGGQGKRGKKAKEQPESRIAFELEDDAEALFLQEVDGMSAGETDEDFGEQLAQFADSWPGGSSRGEQPWADGGRGERRGSRGGGGSRGSSAKGGSKGRSTAKVKGSEALPLIEIDLHHHSRAEAEQLLVRRLEELRSLHRAIRVRIITGKGRRSADGQGVLVRTIHSFVSSRFQNDIQTIQPCPSTSTIDGRPIRGYFDVTFRF